MGPKTIFISYVHSDEATISRLVKELRTHGINVWLDADSLLGGDRWSSKIREAIRATDHFIACFSPAYCRRERTYMNTELTMAVDELQMRRPDGRWFLPVRLEPCELPDRNLGGGATLRDLHAVDLYPDWDAGIQYLIRAITAGHTSQPTPDAARFHADELLAAERWDDAITAYREYLRHHASDREAWRSMWYSSIQSGDRSAGVEASAGWTAAEPGNALVWEIRARELILGGRTEAGTDAARRCLELDPDNVSAGRDYGVGLFLTRQLDQLRSFLPRWPDMADVAGMCLKAKALAELGHHREAAELAALIIERDPTTRHGWQIRISSLRNLGDEQQAVEVARRWAATGDLEGKKTYSLELNSSRMWAPLVELLDAGWPGSDKNPHVQVIRARALAGLGRHREAIQCACRAGELAGPGEAPTGVWEVQQRSMYELGDHVGSAAAARALLKAFPDNTTYRFLLARSLVHAKRFDEALEATDQWVAVEPNASAWFWRVQSLLGLKRFAEACDNAERVARLRPVDPLAMALLAETYAAAGDLRRAVHHAERRLEATPDSAEAQRLLAQYTNALAEAEGAR